MYKRRKKNPAQTPSTQITPEAAFSRMDYRAKSAYQAYSDGNVASKRDGQFNDAWRPRPLFENQLQNYPLQNYHQDQNYNHEQVFPGLMAPPSIISNQIVAFPKLDSFRYNPQKSNLPFERMPIHPIAPQTWRVTEPYPQTQEKTSRVILANKTYKHTWISNLFPGWIDPTPLLPGDINIRSASLCIFIHPDTNRISQALERYKHVVVGGIEKYQGVVCVPGDDLETLVKAAVVKREVDIGAFYTNMDEEFCRVVSSTGLLRVALTGISDRDRELEGLKACSTIERLVFASEAELMNCMRVGQDKARRLVDFWMAEN
jgi:hypothetical protein